MEPLKKLLTHKTENFRDAKFAPILHNLQANILKHHRRKFALYAFIRFNPLEPGLEGEATLFQAKNFLSMQDLPSAYKQLQEREHPKDKRLPITCLYLSYAGYKYLGFSDHHIPAYPESEADFSLALGLKGTAFKKEFRFREDNYEKEVHALLLIASDDSSHLNDKMDQISTELQDFAEVFFEFGKLSTSDKGEHPIEWFGFKDGISNPRFFPSNSQKNIPNYELPSPLKLVLREDTLGAKPYSSGSFATFLKLEQHEDAFSETTKRVAQELSINDDHAAALLLGRNKEGKPLIDSSKGLNDFDYSKDPYGKTCPFHAHIRQANPRTGYEHKRIARRGMLYESSFSKKKGKGLLFMSFQGDLEWQFEDMIRRMYRYSTGETNRDPIVFHTPYSNHIFPYDRNQLGEKTFRLKRLVTFRGGYYFFAPSIPFFKRL